MNESRVSESMGKLAGSSRRAMLWFIGQVPLEATVRSANRGLRYRPKSAVRLSGERTTSAERPTT